MIKELGFETQDEKKTQDLSDESLDALDKFLQQDATSWVTFFPQLLSQQMTLLLCNAPWKVSFKKKDGTIDEKATQRWNLISSRSDWNQFTKRLVAHLSIYGRAATPVVAKEGIPVFSLAQSIINWEKLIGYKLSFITVVQRWDHSLVQRIYQSSYDKYENTNQLTIKVTDEGGEVHETTKVEKEKHNYGFVPVVWWENRTREFETESGLTDTELVTNTLRRMDLVWNKIGDEIYFASTEIASYANEGSFMEEMLSPKQQQTRDLKIRQFFRNNIRQYLVNSNNNDNKQFYVNQKRAEIDGLRKEFNELLNSVIFFTGGIQFKDRSGTVQITDTQNQVNRNSSYLVCQDKIHQLEKGVRELVDIIIKVDTKPEYWTDVAELEVDIFVSDPALEAKMRDNPENFLKLGYSIEDLIRQIKKIPNHEILQVKQKIEHDVMYDPLTNFLLTKDISMFKALVERKDKALADQIEKTTLTENTSISSSAENESTEKVKEEAIKPNFEIKDKPKPFNNFPQKGVK